MKTVTVRELRYEFPKIEALLAGGKELEITKRGKAIAHVAPVRTKTRKVKMPDFKARLKAIYGKKILKKNLILEERASYRW